MVDLQDGSLEPEKKPETASDDASKKLVFGDEHNAVGNDSIKIEDSPKKRWKIFAIIGGFVALMIGISIAMNWQSISQNFTGSFMGPVTQEPLNLPEGTVVYDAYQAADGTVYLKVPWWDCQAGEEPDYSKPGQKGVAGTCKDMSLSTSDHDYTIYSQPRQYWDCPAGFEIDGSTAGGCYKKAQINLNPNAALDQSAILGAQEGLVKDTDLVPDLKCPIGSTPQGGVCIPVVDDGAAVKAIDDCPDGTKKLMLATGKFKCVTVDAGASKPGGGKTNSCISLEAKIKTYEEALLPKNTKGKRSIEIEMLEFLLTKVVQEGLADDCDVDIVYRNAGKCSDQESFDSKTHACKSAPGYTKVGDKNQYDCDELSSAMKAINEKLANDKLSHVEEVGLKTLKAGLLKGGEFCKNSGTKTGTDGGKAPATGEPAAGAETTTCPADQHYDETKKACISNTNLACTALDTKIKGYKEALLDANTKDKSAVQIEVLEFLFTKAVQSALDEKCAVNEDYQDAEKCTEKESFDKKAGACKSAPGYTKVGNNLDEYDCTELESAITAIDLQLLSDDLNNMEKSALTSLKLDLVNGKAYCKTQNGNNGGGSNGGNNGGGGSSGGGGGGGGSASNSKTFEIKNVKVQPEEFNPFAENTTIYFFITHDAYVSLQVLDGDKVIQTTKEEKMNAGDRNISWDGKKSQGGFVPENDYTLKIVAKKASNKSNKVEEEADVTVKYFDSNLDLPKDPSFEGDSGTVIFTGTGSGSGSGTGSGSNGISNGSSNFGNSGSGAGTSQAHGTSGPLAQKIYGEGKGKNTTSKTGPETVAYLLLLVISVGVVFLKPMKKHRKKNS